MRALVVRFSVASLLALLYMPTSLAQNQADWDWFLLHLDDGNKLMLYRLRKNDREHRLSGSWITRDGKKQHLRNDEIELIENASREVNITENKTLELPLE